MRLLLDTNVFLWLVQQEPIPAGVLAQLEDPSNELFASLVTPWEMQIKVGVGKLKLAQSVRSVFQAQLIASSMTLLPIALDHIDALSRLPNHHRDPFDRLLIAQAIHEGLTIVSSDHQIRLYPVAWLWD